MKFAESFRGFFFSGFGQGHQPSDFLKNMGVSFDNFRHSKQFMSKSPFGAQQIERKAAKSKVRNFGSSPNEGTVFFDGNQEPSYQFPPQKKFSGDEFSTGFFGSHFEDKFQNNPAFAKFNGGGFGGGGDAGGPIVDDISFDGDEATSGAGDFSSFGDFNDAGDGRFGSDHQEPIYDDESEFHQGFPDSNEGVGFGGGDQRHHGGPHFPLQEEIAFDTDGHHESFDSDKPKRQTHFFGGGHHHEKKQHKPSFGSLSGGFGGFDGGFGGFQERFQNSFKSFSNQFGNRNTYSQPHEESYDYPDEAEFVSEEIDDGNIEYVKQNLTPEEPQFYSSQRDNKSPLKAFKIKNYRLPIQKYSGPEQREAHARSFGIEGKFSESAEGISNLKLPKYPLDVAWKFIFLIFPQKGDKA